ncbi:MAG: metallophosphoesterase [Thermomicrobiales bacterium]
MRRSLAFLLMLSLLSGQLFSAAARSTAAAEPDCQPITVPPVYEDTVALTLRACLDLGVKQNEVAGLVDVSITYEVQRGPRTGVRSVLFQLDGHELLTDFDEPFQFHWETRRWPDGEHRFTAKARLRNGDVATASTKIELANKNKPPPPVPAFTVPTVASKADPPIVLAAVGDGPDGGSAADAVGDLIASWDPQLLLYLGDVYEHGLPDEFANWYEDAFGSLRKITLPAPGNHELQEGEAEGYFGYWGNPPPYYSSDAGNWHLIELNSSTSTREVSPGSEQYEWLVGELAAHADACTIVFFHHPVFSIGPQGDTERMSEVWQMLADAGVEIVLTGHDHDYQRWQPLDASGNPDDTGTTQFVVGTGGHGIQAFDSDDARVVTGVDDTGAYGALRLQLYPDQAKFAFITINGKIRDRGTIPCEKGGT